MNGLYGGRLVPPLTEEEKEWIKTATKEDWIKKFGVVSGEIAFTDITYLYKRDYRG